MDHREPLAISSVHFENRHSGSKLPDGWECGWDDKHSRYYFYNRTTQERSWSLDRIVSNQGTCTFDPSSFSKKSNACSDLAFNSPSLETKLASDDCSSPRDRKRRAANEFVQMHTRAHDVVVQEIHSLSENFTKSMKDIFGEIRRMRESAVAASLSSGDHSEPIVKDAGINSKLANRWIHKRHEYRKRKTLASLVELLRKYSLDPFGKHCREEIAEFSRNDEVQEFFEKQVRVDPFFLMEVFDLLDTDGDHKVSMGELIDGCLELKDEPIVRKEMIHSCSIDTSKAAQSMSESLLRANPKPRHTTKPMQTYLDDAGNPQLPDVEIAIRVNHLANVDTSDLTFQVDLTVFLDWVDERIPDDVMRADELDWENDFFNPDVVVEGTEEGFSQLSGGRPFFAYPDKDADSELYKNQETWCFRNGQMHKWCSKVLRFHGTLCIPEIDLRMYPFDSQLLPLKFRARSSTFGDVTHAQVNLIPPFIRRFTREYHSCRAAFRFGGSFCASTPTGRCMADSMVEFKLCGLYTFSAHNLLETSAAARQVFQVTIIVKRPVLGHTLWEFSVLFALTLLSAVSFWDTASPEVSSRMSITLTIILTFAAYTSTRPAAIEKVPYSTVQDIVELVGMGIVITVCVLNVVAVVMCGGEDEEAPAQMQRRYEWFKDSLCDEASFAAMRWIDWIGMSIFLVMLLISMVCLGIHIKINVNRLLKRKLRENLELWSMVSGFHETQSEKDWSHKIEDMITKIMHHIWKERCRAKGSLKHLREDAKVAPDTMTMMVSHHASKPSIDASNTPMLSAGPKKLFGRNDST